MELVHLILSVLHVVGAQHTEITPTYVAVGNNDAITVEHIKSILTLNGLSSKPFSRGSSDLFGVTPRVGAWLRLEAPRPRFIYYFKRETETLKPEPSVLLSRRALRFILTGEPRDAFSKSVRQVTKRIPAWALATSVVRFTERPYLDRGVASVGYSFQVKDENGKWERDYDVLAGQRVVERQ